MRWPAALLVAALGCAFALSLTGCGRASQARAGDARGPSTPLAPHAPVPPPSGPPAAVRPPVPPPAPVPPRPGSMYSLMQMNLCLSGLASCYGKTAYPAVVGEAVARIRQVHPDAVTVNEACRSDVALIARRTGYHLRFSRVLYFVGEPLPCIRPGGRGLFGDAVLTEAAVEGAGHQDLTAPLGIEGRQWLCVTTRVGVEVCTAHLSTRTAIEVSENDVQCTELAAVLARRAAAGPVIFGGDVNRRGSCAPDGLWTRSDGGADQDAGLQQVYGGGAFLSPSAEVVPATHTDHDFLLVRAHLAVTPRERRRRTGDTSN